MTPPSVAELTLLDYVSLLWIGLNTLVLVSPLVKLLTDAGSYGKLQNSAEEEEEDGDHRKDRTLQPTDASPPPQQQQSSSENKQESVFLHPRFYIRTETAFTSYYAFACLWNGWLLFEADVS